MGEKIEAAADGDQLRAHLQSEFAQAFQIHRVAIGQHGRSMGHKAIKPGAACRMVGDVAADGAGWSNDHVARLRQRHEAIKVRHGAGGNADLRMGGLEDFSGEFGCNNLDLLNGLKPHLVFVARIAEGRASAEAAGLSGFRARVHHVGGRVEIEAFLVVDGEVAADQSLDPFCRSGGSFPGRGGCDFQDAGFARRGNPGAADKAGHADIL